MLGTIIGDIVGSVYEFNNFKSKGFDPFFHEHAHFTDDTVCTVAIADALTGGIHPGSSLKAWGAKYWENGGWGRSFALWLGSDDSAPYGSFGNGSAMRVSPAGLLATSLEEAIRLSNAVTEVTHNHPEGMKGAAATAAAIYLAKSGLSKVEIRQFVAATFGYDLERSVDEIRPGYVFNERCQDSVPQALTCALEAKGFEDAIRNAISIGGDSDTIAAIAGGVAEAMFGIPEPIARKGWGYLPEEMREVITRLYDYAESARPYSLANDVAPMELRDE